MPDILWRRLADVVYLFGVGVALVSCIASARPDWAICVVGVVPLVVYMLGSVDPGPVTGAALCVALFPAVEALCVRMGASGSGVPTWSYPANRGRAMPLGVPTWLFVAWACAGAFVVALFDAVASFCQSTPATGGRRLQVAVPFIAGLLAAVVALIVTAHTRTTTWGACVAAVAATLALAWTFGSIAPAVLTAAAVAVAFPLLEALCVRFGAWRYHTEALVPLLNVPPWLFPVWGIVAIVVVFSAQASRALST